MSGHITVKREVLVYSCWSWAGPSLLGGAFLQAHGRELGELGKLWDWPSDVLKKK